MTHETKDYTEYCNLFSKTLQTCFNSFEGPCSSKKFDALINNFVKTLYAIEGQHTHPFASEQDAYEFTYLIIFTLMMNKCTTEEFKKMAMEINVSEQFLEASHEFLTAWVNMMHSSTFLSSLASLDS